MATIATTAVDTLPKRPNAVWQFIKAQPFGMAGLLMILLYVVFAFGAAYISPFNPEEIDFAGMLSPPSATHWFGTDQYGRDVFSRIVYGSRTALAVGILSAVIGCTVGALIGAASGYFAPDKELVRQAVNAWIRGSGEWDGVVDFEAVVRDPARPSRFRPEYDDGDHLHLNAAGHRAMGDAVDLGLFTAGSGR